MRAAVERVLHDVWSHRGIAASLLYPFSLVYLAIARRRAGAIQIRRRAAENE